MTNQLLIEIPAAAFLVFAALKAESAYQMWKFKRFTEMRRKRASIFTGEARPIGYIENAAEPRKCDVCGKPETTFHEYSDGTARCLYCHIASYRANQ